MNIGTIANNMAKVFATNSTQTGSFATSADSLTEPSGDGYIELAPGASRDSTNNVLLTFFGAGSANNTGTVRVYGVWKAGTTWKQIPLFEGTLTLGTKTGVSGGDVSASELYADTLVVASAYSTLDGAAFSITSPADDTEAHLMIDSKGARKLRVAFNRGGSATSLNALASQL